MSRTPRQPRQPSAGRRLRLVRPGDSGGHRLPRTALEGWSTDVAPTLLGTRLVSTVGGERVAVRLSEVEAYMGRRDPASHAFRGLTRRNGVMFGPAGHLYVYFTYGMHWCANVVCGEEGVATAVLLRAGEVVEGLDAARARRPTAKKDAELARGPARLAAALGIDGSLNEADVVDGDTVFLEGPGAGPGGVVRTGPRVGVRGKGGDGELFPWRFWLEGDPTVSVYRPAQSRRAAERAARRDPEIRALVEEKFKGFLRKDQK